MDVMSTYLSGHSKQRYDAQKLTRIHCSTCGNAVFHPCDTVCQVPGPKGGSITRLRGKDEARAWIKSLCNDLVEAGRTFEVAICEDQAGKLSAEIRAVTGPLERWAVNPTD